MLKISRRQFLYLGGAVLGGAVLGKLWGVAPYLRYYTAEPDAGEGSPRRVGNVFKQGDKSLVGVSSGGGVPAMVAEAVRLAGGIRKLKVKNRSVLIKPNAESRFPYPATTNPEVATAVASLFTEAGAGEVVVSDMSNLIYLPTSKTLKKLGIKDLAEKAGAGVSSFDDGPWRKIKTQSGHILPSFLAAYDLLKFDRLVSIPSIKTHARAVYSGALMNVVGGLHPRSRLELFRLNQLEEAVAEVASLVQPDLVVVDGTKSMVSGGPNRGEVVETNLVAASGDSVAADVFGLSVVKGFGRWRWVTQKSVWEQRQIKRAVELGLGAKNGGQIKLQGKEENEWVKKAGKLIKS